MQVSAKYWYLSTEIHGVKPEETYLQKSEKKKKKVLQGEIKKKIVMKMTLKYCNNRDINLPFS